MKTYKANRAITYALMLAALLVLAACGGGADATAEPDLDSDAGVDAGAEADGDSSADVGGSGSGLCANDYYPVVEGASHSYVGTGGPGGDYTFTFTVTAVREDGFALTSEFEGVTVTQDWSCTEDGLVALTYGGGSASAITASGSETSFETNDVTGVTLPASIAVGDTWSQTFNITGTQSIPGTEEVATVEGSASASYEAIGEESVETETGTFTALKVAVSHTIDLTITLGGVSSPSLFTSSGHIWYVSGIGWVQSVDRVEIAGGTYESSIEMTAYSLPE